MVPWVTGGAPVRGVIVASWRRVRSAYQANSTTGSPSAMTMSAPGKTHPGTPTAMTAARAMMATAAAAAA
jgi:hypothetical protein